MSFSERTPFHLAAAAVAFAASALVSMPAHATPTFPQKIQREVGLAAEPACTLCHAGATQRGTVTTPFGSKLRSRGLVAYDENSLAAALSALEGEQADSDGDGVSDIDELVAGSDPNASGGAGKVLLIPEYGCATVSGRRSAASLGLVLAIALFLFAVRRRSAR